MEEIRIQKYIADCGFASRRKAESEIENGEVKVNGHPATIGQKIDPKKDIVIFKGKRVTPITETKYYIKLHKPRGYVTTMNDEKGRKCVADLVKDVPARIYPIGRLDLESEGLVLMTNDGELANRLMHPSDNFEKVYIVKTREIPSNEQLLKLNGEMEIDGYKIRPCKVNFSQDLKANKLIFRLVEGRNRQIRKMCENVGLEVTRLKRVQEGKICLDGLGLGKWEYLTDREVEYLKKV